MSLELCKCEKKTEVDPMQHAQDCPYYIMHEDIEAHVAFGMDELLAMANIMRQIQATAPEMFATTSITSIAEKVQSALEIVAQLKSTGTVSAEAIENGNLIRDIAPVGVCGSTVPKLCKDCGVPVDVLRDGRCDTCIELAYAGGK
jgi:hypothetical protein